MAQQVDPFIHPIPKEFLSNHSTRSYYEYLHRFLHDLWKRTGGGSDLVADTGTREAYPWSQDDAGEEIKQDSVSNYSYNEIRIEKLTKKVINRESYTCSDNMFILMQNNSKLTLPKHPVRDSVVWFFKQDSTLATINGNGRKINGVNGNITFRKPGIGRQVHYFEDIGEWVFI